MQALRVLVIEDHAFQRLFMVKALTQLGLQQVLETSSGVEALELLGEKGAVDVVLCDLRMSGMDGLTFLRQVGQRRLARSVILCTELAPDLRGAVQQIVRLHGFEFLGDIGKPLDLVRLRTLIMALSPMPQTLPLESAQICDLQEHELMLALERQEIRAYFQPKFLLKTGEAIGAEVLARWVRADGSVMSPATFLPAFERFGLLDAMFFSLLDQGLSLQRKVQTYGKPFRLAFNLHVEQMGNPMLIERIQLSLKTHELPLSGLQFELIESGLLKAPADCLEGMVRLRMMGCGLSIDDFGVGYSSLERLCQMPFNEVKIDAGFIHNMQGQPRYLAAVSNTLALAHELGMLVVAEGLETQAQVSKLIEMGCSVGQGFYLERPMGFAQMVAWVQARSTSYWCTRQA